MDWYFDFVSPYAYLQLEHSYDWLAGVPVTPKPVLLAGLLDHWGQKGPGEIAPKRTFTYRQVQWLAQRDGIAFRFPPRHPFNPLRPLRLAIALECALEPIRTIYRHIWRDGGEVDTEEDWAALLAKLGLREAEGMIGDAAVKAQLRRNGEDAIAAGVFGVPTLVADGMLFWGYDSTAMAMDYLRDPQRFRSPEMRRLESLAVGASRSR